MSPDDRRPANYTDPATVEGAVENEIHKQMVKQRRTPPDEGTATCPEGDCKAENQPVRLGMVRCGVCGAVRGPA